MCGDLQLAESRGQRPPRAPPCARPLPLTHAPPPPPQELDSYRQVWEFGHSWDAAAFGAAGHGLMRIRRDLGLQKRWREQLDKMKTSLAAGCLQVGAADERAVQQGHGTRWHRTARRSWLLWACSPLALPSLGVLNPKP